MGGATRAEAAQERRRQRWRRRKRTRLAAWLAGDGIEVGALYRPLEVPPQARVRYLDRMPVEGLREHYPELADEPLVPVDIISSAEDLGAVPDASVDFVIANHLFEHMEYPVRALQSFLRVLRPGGRLYLALPDQRTGIDLDRPLTTIEHLLDEHRHGAEANREQHYRDWCELAEKREDVEGWTRRRMDMGYSIHFHVWRPDTFLDFLSAVRRDVGLEFEVLAFAAPEYPGDDELIVVLSKGISHYPLVMPPALTLRQRVSRSPYASVLRPPYRLARRMGAGIRRLVPSQG